MRVLRSIGSVKRTRGDEAAGYERNNVDNDDVTITSRVGLLSAGHDVGNYD